MDVSRPFWLVHFQKTLNTYNSQEARENINDGFIDIDEIQEVACYTDGQIFFHDL